MLPFDPVATAKVVFDFLSDPKLWAFIAAMGPLAAWLGAQAVKQPDARKYAKELADMSELVEPWVRGAEKLPFATGAEKAAAVLDQYQQWAAANGIKGEADAALKKWLPGFMEAAVKKVDPKG